MNLDSNASLRKRLMEQISYLDEQRAPFLDMYFPHEKYAYQERERHKKFLDRYVSTVETIIEQLEEATDFTLPKVLIGSEVSLFYSQYEEEETITICLPEKADPDLGYVSFLSPIAAQILLRSQNEAVQLETPQGETEVVIQKITFIDW